MANDENRDLQSQITQLTARIGKLETQPIEPTVADARIIARMQGNASWAIHYSTVRMTIGTFFITTCLTIMGFKWSEPTLPLVLAAATIWTAGFLLFLDFTRHTARMRVESNSKRDLLLLAGEKKSKATADALIKHDGPRLAVIVLTVLYAAFLIAWSHPLWVGRLEPEGEEPAITVPASGGVAPSAEEETLRLPPHQEMEDISPPPGSGR